MSVMQKWEKKTKRYIALHLLYIRAVFRGVWALKLYIRGSREPK